VGEGFDEFEDFHIASQFLTQFAPETGFEGFVRFAFAARKLPQTAQVRVRVPLGDEQFPVTEDEPGRDFDDPPWLTGFRC
jgi:hypothetical protein